VAPPRPAPPPPPPPVPPPPAPPPIPPSAPCNAFPLVFGANSGHSYLNQIDIYGDYLALAGDTNDQELTGSTSQLPYIAMMSMSISNYFYWAKAFPQEPASTMAGVQFSSDGTILIAHGSSISSFILIFNASTGIVKSSRGYNAGGFQNYNSAVRSMLVSGGLSPKAYVTSN
jgi:hypothetical protein